MVVGISIKNNNLQKFESCNTKKIANHDVQYIGTMYDERYNVFLDKNANDDEMLMLYKGSNNIETDTAFIFVPYMLLTIDETGKYVSKYGEQVHNGPIVDASAYHRTIKFNFNN